MVLTTLTQTLSSRFKATYKRTIYNSSVFLHRRRSSVRSLSFSLPAIKGWLLYVDPPERSSPRCSRCHNGCTRYTWSSSSRHNRFLRWSIGGFRGERFVSDTVLPFRDTFVSTNGRNTPFLSSPPFDLNSCLPCLPLPFLFSFSSLSFFFFPLFTSREFPSQWGCAVLE